MPHDDDDEADGSTSALSPPGSSYYAPARPRPKRTTPLPAQLWIVLLAYISEPVAYSVIQPFLNQMIGDFDVVGGNMARVGYWRGIMVFLYSLTEVATVLQWSSLSDRIGRKPVLLIGLAGTVFSLIGVGLSRSFWPLVITRCLQGLTDGNQSVIRSVIAEITDLSNSAQGYAFLSVTWPVGATASPLIGGLLENPHRRYPGVFTSPFWETYPYFLPCFVASLFSALCFAVIALRLEETVGKSSTVHRHSRTISTMRPTSMFIDPLASSTAYDDLDDSETIGLLEVSTPPAPSAPTPLRRVLTPRVRLAITVSCAFSVLETSLYSLLVLFFSSPIPLGGLGLDPAAIGLLLSVYGLVDGAFQALVTPWVLRRYTLKAVYVCGVAAFAPLFAAFPVINAAAREAGGITPVVWVLVGAMFALKIAMEMAYCANYIYVSASAPNKSLLGATNGIASLTTSIIRAVSPAVFDALFAFSAEHRVLGGNLVYVVALVLTAVALRVVVLLPTHAWTGEEELQPE